MMPDRIYCQITGLGSAPTIRPARETKSLALSRQEAARFIIGEAPVLLRRAPRLYNNQPDTGDAISLHMRDTGTVIASARVAFRAVVTLSPRGLVGADHWRAAEEVSPLARKCEGLFIYAARDGFPDKINLANEFARLTGYPDFRAYWSHMDQYRARNSDSVTMTRELFGFDRIIPA